MDKDFTVIMTERHKNCDISLVALHQTGALGYAVNGTIIPTFGIPEGRRDLGGIIDEHLATLRSLIDAIKPALRIHD